MKKLLSIFAAAAVLFGLASCSGDLHDNTAPSDLYIIGALKSSTWDKTEKMTTVSAGVYEITTDFAANAEFKFIIVADKGNDSWDKAQEQYGSDGYSSNGQAKNFKLGNDAAGKYKVTYNLVTGTLSSEDATPKPSISIKISSANGDGYADNTVLKIIGVGNDALTIQGSLSNWCGGDMITLSGDGPDYEVTATATQGYVSWIEAQNLYENEKEGDGLGAGFPTVPVKANRAAKLSIGGTEAWVCFVNGATYEFDWANRKE